MFSRSITPHTPTLEGRTASNAITTGSPRQPDTAFFETRRTFKLLKFFDLLIPPAQAPLKTGTLLGAAAYPVLGRTVEGGEARETRTGLRYLGQGGGTVWRHHFFNWILPAAHSPAGCRCPAHYCRMLFLAVLTRAILNLKPEGRTVDESCSGEKPEVPERHFAHYLQNKKGSVKHGT